MPSKTNTTPPHYNILVLLILRGGLHFYLCRRCTVHMAIKRPAWQYIGYSSTNIVGRFRTASTCQYENTQKIRYYSKNTRVRFPLHCYRCFFSSLTRIKYKIKKIHFSKEMPGWQKLGSCKSTVSAKNPTRGKKFVRFFTRLVNMTFKHFANFFSLIIVFHVIVKE